MEGEAEAKSALLSAPRRWLPDTTAPERACSRAAEEIALDRKASLEATRRHEAGNLRGMVSSSGPAQYWPACDQDTHAPRYNAAMMFTLLNTVNCSCPSFE